MNDSDILNSWQINAAPWTTAVRQQQIESRRLVTDQAIVDTVTSLPGNSVLDVGCGEGWLVRALTGTGHSASGIDAIPALVAKAREMGNGSFFELAYEHLSGQALPDRYDIAVCNFSLLGQQAVNHVFQTMPEILTADGHLVVQTLHPVISCGDHPYADGWREGSWDGFSPEFKSPAPWYFRTIASWFQLFRDSGFDLVQVYEPIHPDTGKPVSLILVGRLPRTAEPSAPGTTTRNR